MEYGDAINRDSLDRAEAYARELIAKRLGAPLDQISADAVWHTYCCCVTDGEDAAERRFSDVHRSLIDQVTARLTGTAEHLRPVPDCLDLEAARPHASTA